MSLARKSIDRTTLPQAMLSLAKLHMRVTADDDDRIILQKLGSAIGTFERLTGYGVFGATWEWVPDASDAVGRGPGGTCEGSNRCYGAFSLYPSGTAALVPVMRVSKFTAVDDASVDVSANYAIAGEDNPDSITPQYLVEVASRTSTGLVVTLSSGFTKLDDVPPDLQEVLLQVTADTFETREAHLIPGVDDTPYANSWMTGWWVPRC